MRAIRTFFVIFFAAIAAMAITVGTASATSGNDKKCDPDVNGDVHSNYHHGNKTFSAPSGDEKKSEDECVPAQPPSNDGDCDHDDVCVTPPVVTPPPPVIIQVPGPTVTVTVPGPSMTVTVPGPTVIKKTVVKYFTKVIVCKCPKGSTVKKWRIVRLSKKSVRVIGNTTFITVRQTVYKVCVPKLRKFFNPPVTG